VLFPALLCFFISSFPSYCEFLGITPSLFSFSKLKKINGVRPFSILGIPLATVSKHCSNTVYIVCTTGHVSFVNCPFYFLRDLRRYASQLFPFNLDTLIGPKTLGSVIRHVTPEILFVAGALKKGIEICSSKRRAMCNWLVRFKLK
jgi:hypothetical protein